MRHLPIILLMCLALSACLPQSPPDSTAQNGLPIIDSATGETVVPTEITLYNSHFGLAVTLPSDTRLYELENLGLSDTDFADIGDLASTSYGEENTVYSLADMALDWGGFDNYCRVILAVEHIAGVDNIDDFTVILSRRLVLSSSDTDYQITFEGSRDAAVGEEHYRLLTFTETQPGEDDYIYEVYVQDMGDAFFTAVLFYNAAEENAAGKAVGQSYLETGITFFA